MSSGITQLIAIGAQDQHLTGSPQVTFFKSSFQRHTNFSMFSKEQMIRGSSVAGGHSTIDLEKDGDLLSYMYLVSYDNTGHPNAYVDGWSNIISYAELIIGGQVVDTQDIRFTEYVAPDLLSQTYAKSSVGSLHSGMTNDSKFYPFRFFFCEGWQHVLPLVAMQYTTVQVRVYWSENLGSTGITSFRCFAQYISLDTDERTKLLKDPVNDILIFQVQKSNPVGATIHDLDFNHPVKFIASPNIDNDNKLLTDTNKVKLEANGIDITPYVHANPYYTTIPSYYHTEYAYANQGSLFYYPFCLSSCKIQPTGSLNFSRLASFKIHSDQPINQAIYAVNYNILRVKNGLCALVYSN